MSPRLRFALLAVLALSVCAAPAMASGPIPEGDTHVVIQLQVDGDARWTVTTRLRIDGAADREAFTSLAEAHESGERPAPWLDQARRASAAAANATGRSMNITRVSRASNATNGTLSVSFTWTNFSRRDGDRLVAGDAFNTTNGTWLDGLTASQVLVIELPDGYGVVSAPRGARIQNARIKWEGPRKFEPGYLRVVASGDTVTATPTRVPPSPTPATGPSPWLWRGGLAALLGALALGAYVLSRRSASDEDAAGSAATGPEEPGDAAASARASGPDGGSTADEPASESVDETLLSDEERVERILERNGGRMKQANIVKETDWSNAKVSQLLSAMEEEGRIDKLRIGRENLISFPDEDVTDVDEE